MTFGENLKELRRKSGITQEKLAELLSVSPQAVSRWETDLSKPDISLLPPLANLFSVTTDYLLGMEDYQKNMRKAEYEEAFTDYWKHDDKEMNYEIACRAVAEYPGNMEWLEWLASDEYYLACVKEGEVADGLYEQAIRHYRIVWENADDCILRDKALEGIVRSLAQKGDPKGAKEYAERHPDELKRDELLCICSEGEDKMALCQKMANRKIAEFLTYFMMIRGGRALEKCEAVSQILRVLFPDGNYQNYHNILQYNEIDRAIALCQKEHYEEAIAALRQARYHAEEMTKWCRQRTWKFTVPLFDLVGGTKLPHELKETDLDEFISCIRMHPGFQVIRDRREFQELLIK